ALIHDLRPVVNVQVADPDLETRKVPPPLRRDVLVVLPSVDVECVELVAARVDGGWLIQRTRRSGEDLGVHARRLKAFFSSRSGRRILSVSCKPSVSSLSAPSLAPIVFSWLARRGASASRLNPHDAPSVQVLAARIAALLRDERLFQD